jgi:hypothetical protein
MTERELLVSAIVALSGGYVAVAGYFIHIHKAHSKKIQEITEGFAKELKTNSVQMVDALLRNSHAMENNVKIMDKIYESTNR